MQSKGQTRLLKTSILLRKGFCKEPLKKLGEWMRHRKHVANRIGVVGVPFDKGQSYATGVQDAPSALRHFGFIKEMIKLGHDVEDFGDIEVESGESPDVPDIIRDLPTLARTCELLSKKVMEIVEDNRKALVFGGDHSIALGSVDGHLRSKNNEVCLLWVDAHADINTADTSNTGNMHGMPVSLLVKELQEYWPHLPGLEWQKPVISIKDLAYIGLRSVDDYERLIIEKYGVSTFGMEDIEKYGIHTVTTLALEKINPNQDKSLHVSFDIDALDTLEAPCTSTSVRGGLTLREAVHLMEVAHRTGRLGVVDIVEINPRLGTPLQCYTTFTAALHIVKAAFGFSRMGYIPKNMQSMPGYYARPLDFK